jgi:hypothetical protein
MSYNKARLDSAKQCDKVNDSISSPLSAALSHRRVSEQVFHHQSIAHLLVRIFNLPVERAAHSFAL